MPAQGSIDWNALREQAADLEEAPAPGRPASGQASAPMTLEDYRRLPIEELQRLVAWARVPAEQQRLMSQARSEEHTSELQSLRHLVCRLLLEKKKKQAE